MCRYNKRTDSVSNKGRLHSGPAVEVRVLREKVVIFLAGKARQEFFVRQAAFHYFRLHLGGHLSSEERIQYAVTGQVFVEDENYAARRSISHRSASSTLDKATS